MTEPSYLFTLRETARQCPNVLTRKLLRDAADDLEDAINTFALSRTVESMQRLNGVWARAAKVLGTAELPGDGGSSGGALREGAKLAA